MNKLNYILFAIVGVILYFVVKKPSSGTSPMYYTPVPQYLPSPTPPPAPIVHFDENTRRQVGEVAGKVGAVADAGGDLAKAFGNIFGDNDEYSEGF